MTPDQPEYAIKSILTGKSGRPRQIERSSIQGKFLVPDFSACVTLIMVVDRFWATV